MADAERILDPADKGDVDGQMRPERLEYFVGRERLTVRGSGTRRPCGLRRRDGFDQ